MSLVKEDWERIYLTDEMYLKEKEWEEQEHFRTGDKPPAKVTLSKSSIKLIKKLKNKRLKK